ncbi:hypothetical protein [Aeromonas sobria]|uniref:hypothetical protein n=1 Tax=Aeromonas sobria TaxID=646 RepID=UPI000C6E50D4|nr:hypothetical protein [Aeromonas sobria]PKQ78102.1 hypothetical protein CJF47_07420 [Aeromonas sobria]
MRLTELKQFIDSNNFVISQLNGTNLLVTDLAPLPFCSPNIMSEWVADIISPHLQEDNLTTKYDFIIDGTIHGYFNLRATDGGDIFIVILGTKYQELKGTIVAIHEEHMIPLYVKNTSEKMVEIQNREELNTLRYLKTYKGRNFIGSEEVGIRPLIEEPIDEYTEFSKHKEETSYEWILRQQGIQH